MPLTEEAVRVFLMGALKSKLDFDQLGLMKSSNFVDRRED